MHGGRGAGEIGTGEIGAGEIGEGGSRNAGTRGSKSHARGNTEEPACYLLLMMQLFTLLQNICRLDSAKALPISGRKGALDVYYLCIRRRNKRCLLDV